MPHILIFRVNSFGSCKENYEQKRSELVALVAGMAAWTLVAPAEQSVSPAKQVV